LSQSLNFSIRALVRSLCLGLLFFLASCEQKQNLSENAKPISVDRDRGLESLDSVEILTPNEQRRLNRAFIKEIYEHVYARPLSDIRQFNEWMNVLSQGASIEGVYRGLTLSDQYRALERGIVSKDARAFFAAEMAYIKKRIDTQLRQDQLEAELLKTSEKASLFSLKRVLGESLLEAVDHKKTDRAELADLYADLVIRWSIEGIDFGVQQRNSTDREFHRDWALKNSRGRIQWELLNRLHRVMNHLGKIVITK
jgi:hypothetical protein